MLLESLTLRYWPSLVLGETECQCKYTLSVVGFLYTVVSTCCSFRINFTSRNGSVWSFSISWVNCIKTLNTFNKRIQCTHEFKKDHTLPFLNVKLFWNEQHVDTTVYRKPTTHNIYLHWQSFVPKSWKISTVKSMILRAYKICSNDIYRKQELKNISEIFTTIDGYPQLHIWINQQKWCSKCSIFLNTCTIHTPQVRVFVSASRIRKSVAPNFSIHVVASDDRAKGCWKISPVLLKVDKSRLQWHPNRQTRSYSPTQQYSNIVLSNRDKPLLTS